MPSSGSPASVWLRLTTPFLSSQLRRHRLPVHVTTTAFRTELIGSLQVDLRWASSSSRFDKNGKASVPGVQSIQNPPSSETKLARIFVMEMNRLRSQYLRDPTVAQRTECLSKITSVPLQRITGLDGRTVAHCLGTLAVLQASPDLPLVHDVALWLGVHGPTLPLTTAAHCVQSLLALNYPDMTSLMNALHESILSHTSDLVPASGAVFLAAAMRSLPATGQDDAVRQLAEAMRTKLQANLTTLGLTEMNLIVNSLAHLHHSAPFIVEGLKGDAGWSSFIDALWRYVMDVDIAALSLVDAVMLFRSSVTAPTSMMDLIRRKVGTQIALQTEGIGQLTAAELVALMEFVVLLDTSSSHVAGSITVEWVMGHARSFFLSPCATPETALALLRCLRRRHDLQCTASIADGRGGGTLSTFAPDFLVQYLCAAISDAVNWSADTVHDVLVMLYPDPAYRPHATRLAEVHYKCIHSKMQRGEALQPNEITALLVEGVVEDYASALAEAVRANLDRWNVSHVLSFLEYASLVPGKPTRAVMRDAAATLAKYVERASAQQVATLMRYFGRAGVRNEPFADAVALRMHALSSELSLRHVSNILGGLAAVEYRSTKPFVDAASIILSRLQVEEGTPDEIIGLMAAYAKMLIWNFRVFWALAERASTMVMRLSLPQLVAAQLALIRMDVQHEKITKAFYERMKHIAAQQTLISSQVSMQETVICLSVLSRTGIKDDCVVEALVGYVAEHQAQLCASEIAELLLSIARMDMGRSPLFDKFANCALTLLPTCSPLAMAHIVTAFSIAKKPHPELFFIVSERTIAMKDTVAAVTIASILAAFATLGIRQDKLFIEMIPRVRFVAQYGSPKDVVNVVYAYATVKLWHYTLFAKLADRAIQLRAEFRCPLIATLLHAYASVGMRYDRLFVEYSPRIQTVAHLLSAEDLTTIVTSYSSLGIENNTVYTACAERALEIPETFTETTANKLLASYQHIGFQHPLIVASLSKQFPTLLQQYKHSTDTPTCPTHVCRSGNAT